jgi:hypothetical protein
VMLSVIACREGSSWVVQAIEVDLASQGAVLLDALVDLGRMFDERDQLIAESAEPIAATPRAPVEYEHAIAKGHAVGVLPLGAVRGRAGYHRDLPLRAEGSVSFTSPRAMGAPHSARAVKVPSRCSRTGLRDGW